MSLNYRSFILALACVALTACASTHTSYVFGLPHFERTAWTVTYPDQDVRPGVMAMLTNSDTGASVLVMRNEKPGASPSSVAAEIRLRLLKRGLRADSVLGSLNPTESAHFNFRSGADDPQKLSGIVVVERRRGADGLFILLANWPAENDKRAIADMAWVANELTVSLHRDLDE